MGVATVTSAVVATCAALSDEDAVEVVHGGQWWPLEVMRTAEARLVTCPSCERQCRARDIVYERGICGPCVVFWTLDAAHGDLGHEGAVDDCLTCRAALEAALN